MDDDLQYRVVTRGIYYCARMLSAQYGTVFTHQEYQKLQKVYSIWICPESASGQHSITEYRMEQLQKLGNLPTEEEDYDKLQVIVITLGQEAAKSENPLIRFLSLLLTSELPLESRKQQLEDEYQVQINESMEEEMSTVCNLGESIARKSRAEGRAEGENRLGTLMTKLREMNRTEDAFRAANDPEYRNRLYREFKIA